MINMEKKCDLCGGKYEFQFNITDNASFFACANHAKELSDIIYSIGDRIGEFRFKDIWKHLSSHSKDK